MHRRKMDAERKPGIYKRKSFRHPKITVLQIDWSRLVFGKTEVENQKEGSAMDRRMEHLHRRWIQRLVDVRSM